MASFFKTYGIEGRAVRIRRRSCAFLLLCSIGAGCGRSALDIGAIAGGDDDAGGETASPVDGANADDNPASPASPTYPPEAEKGPDVAVGIDATAPSMDAFAEVSGNDTELADVTLFCGDVQAVPECVLYERLLGQCLMHEYPIACEPGVLPVGDADVDAIEQLCASNVQQVRVACR